jgi:hypothetical protein
MAEIIVTLDGSQSEPLIRIHPWIYDLSSTDAAPSPTRVKVLPGVSPVRQALVTRRALAEQELHGWEKVSLQRIRIGADTAPPSVESASDVDSGTRTPNGLKVASLRSLSRLDLRPMECL